MNRRLKCLMLLTTLFAWIGSGVAWGEPSRVERLSEEVYVVRDDDGNWGGGTMGITHQRGPHYQAKKILDLADVPQAVWQATTEVRLSVWFCVRDYSWHDSPKANGLDEAFEIVLNDKSHPIATNSGLPVYVEGKPMDDSMRWHDFPLAKEVLKRGPNEIVFRMVAPEGKRSDDYLYLGIDNSVAGGNSWVKFHQEDPWHQDKLTVPGGKGEYMVRLYLIGGPMGFQSTWRPAEGRFDDPLKMFWYAGSHGDATRVEWDPLRLDRLSPVTVEVQTSAPKEFALHWLDEQGEPVAPPIRLQGPSGQAGLSPPLPFVPSGVQLDKKLPLVGVTLKASRNYHPLRRRVDMVPHVGPPMGSPIRYKPTFQIEADKIFLANGNLECKFQRVEGRLRLVSLSNGVTASEMIRSADDCALFLVEVADKRYAGSRDFTCRSVSEIAGRHGFAATLFCEALKLEAAMSVWIDSELHMALTVTNRAEDPIDFKVAFPHLAGLAVSDDPAGDYYFFPSGGGIISDTPAVIRQGYGDHQVIYQLMDLFSPQRGGGLAVRCTDDDGRYKVLSLRKYVPGREEINADAPRTPTADEFKWTNSLPQVPGIGLTYEYLRRTRKPGDAFSPKEVAFQAHPGDWRVPMRAYADWCHRVWQFRRYPSRLGPVVNMLAAGWGKSPLFGDGKYRTDFIQPRCDCIELMSWWEWAPLGPWRTPWDQLEKKLGPALYKRYSSYYVPDPVTGKTMYPINRGDYDGYNQRWGGLPAFQQAVKTYRQMGPLVTLYTDPLLADDNTRCGQKWGKLWGIVQPDGSHRTNYESWNMCHDVAEYRRYVADTMRRVIRETDADGIRLDEYGHCGAACFNKQHRHTFAEPGCTEWQRCIAETSKMVRQAMDEVKPGSVLTTEHPGYDYLMQYIEGCITYDLTVHSSPLRPLECNLQRFYFPECKAYELDHRGADRKHRKRFWNAVGSFGSYYPADMDTILRENGDAFSGRQCEPLVPTLAKYVYANRFGSQDKTVYTLYNATGHSFAGPVLEIDLATGEHVFDLLRCKEADRTTERGLAVVSTFLPRDDVTCLVRLPVRLGVKRSGNVLEATVRDPGQRWRISVCDADGQPLLSRPATGESTRLDLGELPKDARPPCCVKLLDGARLVDVVPLPSHTTGSPGSAALRPKRFSRPS